MLHSREHVLVRIVNSFLVRNVNNFGDHLQMQIESIYKEAIEKLSVSFPTSGTVAKIGGTSKGITTEIMNLIIQHEYYKETLGEKWLSRDVEQDAIDADAEIGKHFG
ncbi:hypothetical protein ES705_12676 [subsurface metagenome]